MVGRATLTMVESSMIISCPKQTTSRASQRRAFELIPYLRTNRTEFMTITITGSLSSLLHRCSGGWEESRQGDRLGVGTGGQGARARGRADPPLHADLPAAAQAADRGAASEAAEA